MVLGDVSVQFSFEATIMSLLNVFGYFWILFLNQYIRAT